MSSSDDEEEEEEIPLVRKGRMRVQEVQKEVDEDEEEEDEEMDELDEDVDGEEEEEMVLPPITVRRPIANLPGSKIPSPIKSRIPQRSSTAPTTTTTALGGPIVASGFSFTAPSVFSPPKDEEVVEEKVVSRSHIRLPKNPAPVSAFAPAPISKSFSAGAPKIGTTIISSTQTILPTPSFSFTAPPPPPIVPQSIEAVDEVAAKESAKLVDGARLPKFSFDLPRAQSGKGMGMGTGEEVDQVEKGVLDLVREMSRKELPIIRL